MNKDEELLLAIKSNENIDTLCQSRQILEQSNKIKKAHTFAMTIESIISKIKSIDRQIEKLIQEQKVQQIYKQIEMKAAYICLLKDAGVKFKTANQYMSGFFYSYDNVNIGDEVNILEGYGTYKVIAKNLKTFTALNSKNMKFSYRYECVDSIVT